MNIVFPKACNLICRFHIDKNVKAKCKMLVCSIQTWNQGMESWWSIVDCDNVHPFEDCVQTFELVYFLSPILVEYVSGAWLRPHKEKFVKAWTDRVMHLSNTTSNRYVVYCICLLSFVRFLLNIGLVHNIVFLVGLRLHIGVQRECSRPPWETYASVRSW